MIKTLMYHKVVSFEKWKTAFDSFSEIRKSAGEQTYSVGTLRNEPNTVYAINTWKSIDDFLAFQTAPQLADAMKAAGVLEPPHTIILNEIETGSL